jgi:hypothetical protein
MMRAKRSAGERRAGADTNEIRTHTPRSGQWESGADDRSSMWLPPETPDSLCAMSCAGIGSDGNTGLEAPEVVERSI